MALKSVLRKIQYGKPIVVVSGLPRSGTSMLMKMLQAGGLETISDGIREADIDNPKGYFELEKVKDLDKGGDKTWLKDYRGKVIKIISFLLKDLPTDNNYQIIFIERHLAEVMSSQDKMLVNRGEAGGDVEREKMIENFENHLWRTKYLLKNSEHLEALYVQHRDILTDPRGPAEEMNRFLGNILNVEAMVSAVDPKLYRNKAK